MASAINVKLFDQDGDEGTDDDITAMGECVLDPTKADATGKLTCSLVNIVDGKEEDAGTLGTLEFLVHDKSRAEELRNKNAAASPPKCEILPVVGNGKQKSKCVYKVSSFVVVNSRSMLTNARNVYAFRTCLCHSNKSACILTVTADLLRMGMGKGRNGNTTGNVAHSRITMSERLLTKTGTASA